MVARIGWARGVASVNQTSCRSLPDSMRACMCHPTETLREEQEGDGEVEMGGGEDPLLSSENAKKKRTRTSLLGLATAVVAGIFGGETLCAGTIPGPRSNFLPLRSCSCGLAWRTPTHKWLSCTGLVLAPMDFAAEEAKGLAYIPSMGIGVLIAAPLLTLAFMALGQAPFQLYTKAAALPGILAGIIWNAGNVSCFTHRNPLAILSMWHLGECLGDCSRRSVDQSSVMCILAGVFDPGNKESKHRSFNSVSHHAGMPECVQSARLMSGKD